LSGDGQHVAFATQATNLFPGDTNGITADVVVRDLMTGVTALVSATVSGGVADKDSAPSGLSDDGRFVLFESRAADLVASDQNNTGDVFRRDMALGTTELVSASATGGGTVHGGFDGNMSGDGRYVAFTSTDDSIVPGVPASRGAVVFERDMLTRRNRQVSITMHGGIPPSSFSATGQG